VASLPAGQSLAQRGSYALVPTSSVEQVRCCAGGLSYQAGRSSRDWQAEVALEARCK
jgi:hypothetical protein